MIDTTYLQENEIGIVNELLSGKGPRPLKDRILLKLYEEPEKTKGGIILPDSTKDNAKYNTVAGMVLKMGPDCFKDGPYKDSEEKGCSIGDWVVFSYKAPNRFDYKGVSLVSVYDDAIEAQIDDPTQIKRG